MGDNEGGLNWRKEYLKITYEAGAYRSYDAVILEATRKAKLPEEFAQKLLSSWGEIKPWPESNEVLKKLSQKIPIAIATNCSKTLGQEAANILDVKIPNIVTAEEAEFYKPHKKPYEKAIETLGLAPHDILFVAGSASDVPGAMALGMDVFWHNKKELTPPRCAQKCVQISNSLHPLLNYFSI